MYLSLTLHYQIYHGDKICHGDTLNKPINQLGQVSNFSIYLYSFLFVICNFCEYLGAVHILRQQL